MSTAVIDLIQHVRDHFHRLFTQGGDAASSTIVAFEPIGIPIAPEMFKLAPEDAVFSRPLAIEQISALANVIPSISGDVFVRTGKSVDDFYNMLLIGSRFIPTEDAPDDLLFTTLKAQAMREFEPMLGSLLMPMTQFHPAYATPGTWFDGAATANWTSYTGGSGQTPPRPGWNEMLKAERHSAESAVARPQTDEPTAARPQNQTPAGGWGWRVAPAEVAPVLTNPHLLGKLERTNQGLRVIQSTPPAAKANGSSSSAKRPDVDDQTAGVAAPASLRRPAQDAARIANIASIMPGRPIGSSSLSIAFQYCLATVERPWLSQAFLVTRGWEVPGYHIGEFSSGTADGNHGLFPALPVAAIVVKDLRISSNWSSAEAVMVQQAIALGPFSLAGRSFDAASSSVFNGGVQIIGWICQVMPLLPPGGDPPPVVEPPAVEPPVAEQPLDPAPVSQPPLDRQPPVILEK